MGFVFNCSYTIQIPQYLGINFNNTYYAQSAQPALPSGQVYDAQQLSENDLTALNYALTLEHLEATFYTSFQANFTSADFDAAGLPAGTYDMLTLIQSHEVAHVNALVATINGRGGSAVAACTYNFPVTNVSSYLTVAALLENTGVTAYDGAIADITDNGLQQIAATIATVEARHASFLNLITGAVPFPAVTDTAAAPNSIISAVSAFIVSCPTQPAAPQFVAQDYNNTYVDQPSSASSSGSPVPQPGATGGNQNSASRSSASFLSIFVAAFLIFVSFYLS